MDDKILEKVYKPGRYLGSEYNVVRKNPEQIKIRAALCFPDIYEIGMSHLGFRIIYGLFNEIDDVCCERVFLPGEDLEKIIHEEKLALSSLESGSPLSGFDILGFSLSYELAYLNVLKMLELSNIPIFQSERGQAHPLVVGGGYSCLNPEVMSDFFDCFVIGEAEELAVELIDKVRAAKSRAAPRKELLKELAGIQGIYVPSLYEVEYNHDQTIKGISPNDRCAPRRIKKRIVSNLDNSFFPQRWVVPYVQTVHDRVILEIMRGCPNACAFCQARAFYYPYRIRSKEKVLGLAEALLKNSGYEEISLLGLSCGDHPKILEILHSLIDSFQGKDISVSLPSLKIKNYIKNIPFLLNSVKKTGLTFAPEAGSDRLRKSINKDINIHELFEVAGNAYKAGYKHIKLYFMMGLPDESRDDLKRIIELTVEIVRLRKAIDGKLGNATISISSFIPKPHTAFERSPMNNIGLLKEKRGYLLSALKSSGYGRAIKMDFHSLEKSFIEAVLARSGRKGGRLIYEVLKLSRQDQGINCREGGFSPKNTQDNFNFNLWVEAFKALSLSPEFYVNRAIGENEILPWSHIDISGK